MRSSRTASPSLSALGAKEIEDLLSSKEFTMDISTVAKGSGRETFVGQSGMNQGTGIGALTDLIKLGVGRLLTWKNRPVYDKLSAIIEDDLLGLVKARVPDLEQKRTAFAEPGAKPASHAFESADGKCKGHVAAYKGGKVDWITTCSFFSESLGFGNLRIDGWTDRSTRAPNMAVHLCIVFNVLFIYISLPPRANLLLDDEYNDFVYATPRGEYRGGPGLSLNDYWVSCIDDKRFKPYFSKFHEVNAFMVAPTTLLYTVKYSKKSLAAVRDLGIAHVSSWLDLLEGKDDKNGVLLKDIESRDTQAMLLQLDVRTRQFPFRDPDTKNVANILGLEITDKIIRTLCGDPEDPIWRKR
uniref:Red chlorophyll catabolite reductase n=1 Tax=Strombidinopsis acuminata TaxID=141414 RepID=A0A7S3U3M3_9SPIT